MSTWTDTRRVGIAHNATVHGLQIGGVLKATVDLKEIFQYSFIKENFNMARIVDVTEAEEERARFRRQG